MDSRMSRALDNYITGHYGEDQFNHTGVNVECPFCGEEGFDLPGLKSHLSNGDCRGYNETEVLRRVFPND